MADHPIDILLRAKDQASKVIKGVNGELSRTARISGMAGKGLATAGRNLAGIGAIGLVGLGVAVKSGLSDLAALEDATTSVDGAIQQMGLTGQVTSGQVAQWANEIESDIGAAFDDKAIVQATTTLLRYGKVTPKNLRKTMEVMTDLAAKTGSVESASELLAKALADPTKAAGRLTRQGIILTKQQQDQIKAMVAANDVAGAQALVLDAVAKSTEGAASASQGKYQRSLSVLADVAEDARKALAEGFLPVIEKVAGMLSKGVSDPKVMNDIRDFGKGMASGLDDLIEIAKALPWGTIGDSLKLAGSGAKAVLEAFVNLPPWVQTAVLTGWGLNKLTGGALGGIVGELAKGLIKGVLGINAGVVNINAGMVNGPGGTPVPVGGGKPLPKNPGGIVVPIVGAVATLDMVQAQDRTTSALKSLQSKGMKISGAPWQRLTEAVEQSAQKQANDVTANDKGEQNKVRAKLDAVKQKQQESLVAFRAGERATTIGTSKVANTTTSGASRITTQSIGNTSRITGAIAANRPIVTTSVKVYVTAASVTQATTMQTRYGPGTGSAGDDDRIGGH